MVKRKPSQIAQDLETLQRRRNLEAERRAKSKADDNAIEAGMAETQQLGEARGEEYDRQPQKRGENRKPIRRLSGLEWLHRQKKITDDQMAAGVRYGHVFRKVATEASIRSILNRDVTGGEGPSIADLIENAEGLANARAKLAMYRGQLGQAKRIVEACDVICGEEKTPREAAQNGREAAVVEALLIAGLDMMIQHLAPMPRRHTQDVADAA